MGIVSFQLLSNNNHNLKIKTSLTIRQTMCAQATIFIESLKYCAMCIYGHKDKLKMSFGIWILKQMLILGLLCT